jgi:ATP-dependent DNA helicase DinG
MSELDDKIRACFPHATFRPGQFEFIKEGIQAFEGGAKNVIVEAPTGTGKTPGIIAIARYFTLDFDNHKNEANNAFLLAPNEREGIAQVQRILGPYQAHMITSLKMLQDQYLKDDKLVKIMKGKGNYLCHSRSAPPGSSCAEHEEMYGRTCSKRNNPCVYNRAKTQAQLARLTLHNFDSFLNQVSLGGSFVPRAILTVDEAHNADDHLIKALAFEMSRDQMQRLGLPGDWQPPTDLADAISVSEWLGEKEKLLMAKQNELQVEADTLQNLPGFRTNEEEKELGSIGRHRAAIEDLRRRLGRYLATHEKPWAVEAKDGDVIGFEPVRSAPFAKSALLDYGERRLFMSATIFDGGRWLRSAINLKKDETHYIAVRCIFPVASRPFVDTAVADTGQKWYDFNRNALYSAVGELLDRHQGVRGVIHCNSYQMAEDVRALVKNPRLVFHSSNTRQSVVDGFMTTSRKDAVLVGVFLREGYDFKDDIARFQILLRLPFAWPDKRTKMREEMEGGYYDWLCAIDLVQTYGRGVRNETDHCVTYCLDKRLKKFLKRAGHMLPDWFKEAVRTPAEVGLPAFKTPLPAMEPKNTPVARDEGFFDFMDEE